jgi:peptidoglycan hydrolase-like protein with peptidoglycan-binding domain
MIRVARRNKTLAAAFVLTLALLALPSIAAATLSKGSSGPAVAGLNMRLAELSYLPAETRSSRFGPATYHGVVAFQMLNGLAPDGVVGPRTRAALETAERPRPRLSLAGSRIEVARSAQIAFLVKGGEVARTIHVSTGKSGFTTPAGTFRVYRREVKSWSYSYHVWLPWAAYFNGGIAFHGHAQVPSYAASHGCVRIPTPFAEEVYRFARVGRVVKVL